MGGIMEILKYSAIALLGLSSLIILIFALRSGRPIKLLIMNVFFGILALVIINLTDDFTGVHIPVNQWTVTGGAVLGIPALCGFLVLKIIIG